MTTPDPLDDMPDDTMLHLTTSSGRHVGYYRSVGHLCRESGLTVDQVYDAIHYPVHGVSVIPTERFIVWLENLERQIFENGNSGMTLRDIASLYGCTHQNIQCTLRNALRKMHDEAIRLRCQDE